jgi:hypothetical protein
MASRPPAWITKELLTRGWSPKSGDSCYARAVCRVSVDEEGVALETMQEPRARRAGKPPYKAVATYAFEDYSDRLDLLFAHLDAQTAEPDVHHLVRLASALREETFSTTIDVNEILDMGNEISAQLCEITPRRAVVSALGEAVRELDQALAKLKSAAIEEKNQQAGTGALGVASSTVFGGILVKIPIESPSTGYAAVALAVGLLLIAWGAFGFHAARGTQHAVDRLETVKKEAETLRESSAKDSQLLHTEPVYSPAKALAKGTTVGPPAPPSTPQPAARPPIAAPEPIAALRFAVAPQVLPAHTPGDSTRAAPGDGGGVEPEDAPEAHPSEMVIGS